MCFIHTCILCIGLNAISNMAASIHRRICGFEWLRYASRCIPVRMVVSNKKYRVLVGAIGVMMLFIIPYIMTSSHPIEPIDMRTSMPLPPEPKLIGREKEVVTLLLALDEIDSSILHIVGPPGVGKSALAIYIAHNRSDVFPYYVDMQDIEDISELKLKILNMASRIGEKYVKIEHWVRHLSRKTLLILDNSDDFISVHKRLNGLYDMLDTMKSNNLKVIITNQATQEPRTLMAHVQRVPLVYLEHEKAKELLVQELHDLVSDADITKLCSLIGGIPLAVMNIKQLLTSEVQTCDIDCIILRLKENPFGLLTESEVQESVSSSIATAYNQLNDDHRQCGWILANLEDKFDDKKASTALNGKLPKVDHQECISRLMKSYLLEQQPMVNVEVHNPACHIDGTNYTLKCVHTDSSRKEYKFYPLIKEYFLHKCEHDDLVNSCYESIKSKRSVKRQQTITESNNWDNIKQTATNRDYCPNQYMFLECATRWQELDNALLFKMKSSGTIDDAIAVGTISTYWARAVLKDLLRTTIAMEYIKSSLSLLEQHNHDEHESKARWLAAYVFYIHYSLQIKWSQDTCTCPHAQVATEKMSQKAHRIDKMYSEIKSDHLAWAARKTFYIDLFCCCLHNNEGCERVWRFWLQGIVSQIATVNIHFNRYQQCKIHSLPKKSPEVILGLWHYSFTKNFTAAKKHLKFALKSKSCECPIRDIAIIMALHMIHTSKEQGHLTASYIGKHLEGRKLIDHRLPNYKTIYDQVVIPFLHEFGRGTTIAKRLAEELKQPPPKPDTTPVSYECELFYWHHNTSYTNFLCLTL